MFTLMKSLVTLRLIKLTSLLEKKQSKMITCQHRMNPERKKKQVKRDTEPTIEKATGLFIQSTTETLITLK